VLYPRADSGDLADFLEAYFDLGKLDIRRKEEMTVILEQALGCLPSGLAYMHQNRIRHRYIKSGNVLIQVNAVLWTDFGHSSDSNVDEIDSTTEGVVDAQTKRYSAPKVLSEGRRNSKADIHSLDCVFLDIFYALSYNMVVFASETQLPTSLKSLIEQIRNMEDASGMLELDQVPSRLHGIADLILLMKSEDPEKRPDANCQIFGLECTGCPTCRNQLSNHHMP
jgi:serine/threonine protein kinase